MALQIADDEGFAAVSMRRVAARLEAGTMTLYHYVQSKDDLVALMDGRRTDGRGARALRRATDG